jgi:hypothetical protein
MNFFLEVVRRYSFAVAIALLLTPAITVNASAQTQQTQTVPSQGPTEAEAFEAAKSLGTAEAWNAFIANYPTGFRADLARAYLKQLSGQTSSPPSAPQQVATPELPAVELTCDQQPTLKSRESNVPAKIWSAP